MIYLENEAETARLGKWLANKLPARNFPAILMRGPLGSGKTCLAREITRNLPNGGEAEVSSPSFTIYNLYPTIPPALHCDLYRCGGDLPEECLEMLENDEVFLMVEWAEHWPAENLPPEYLDISFKMVNDSRSLQIGGKGKNASSLVGELEMEWKAEKNTI